MAELAAPPAVGEDLAPSTLAHTQLLAVAWLRWRIFVNGFRRQRPGKRHAVSLVFTILLYLVVFSMLAVLMIGPAIACGIFAWMAIAQHHPQYLLPLLTVVFFLWQFIALNGLGLAAVISSFDPSSLLRFPLPFGRYLVLRTLLGLLTPSTIAGCLALLAAAIGIGVANYTLALPALIVLTVYALLNVFFTRMLAAWLERWLAIRRAREIFSALMVLIFLGIQLLNLRFSTLSSQPGASSWFPLLLRSSARFLHWLPPGFAANSILFNGHPVAQLAQFTALLASTSLFLAIFALRLHKQFLGEYLSEGPARSTASTSASRLKRLSRQPAAAAPSASSNPARPVFPPILAACLRKEWIYFRSNTGQLIGLLTPLIFLLVLSRGIFARHPAYFLPGAIGYVLIGLLPGLYNTFGTDGAGVQLYLLAPIRLRDVVLAKNLASLILIFSEVTLAWTVVFLLAGTPIPLSTQISAAAWTIFVIAVNLTVGTLRSIQAPVRIVPGQTRQTRTATNRTSTLLVLALFFGTILLQIPVTLLCRYFNQPWLAAIVFAPLAASAIMAYAFLLRSSEQLILRHRDSFAEELCKAA